MKKWIITCNPHYYDVTGAFKAFNTIQWKQSVNIKVGDIVYIYVGKPHSSIKFETKAIEVNLPTAESYDREYVIDGTNFENHGRYMELQLLRTFNDEILPYEFLKDEGLKSVQGPSKVTSQLEAYIIKRTSGLKHANRQYFFVFQNKSYKEESKGGFLWAPQYGENQRKVSHWDQMRDVRKNDLIIHSYLKKIVAISIAKTDVYAAERPATKGLHDEWNNNGWRVDAEYIPITDPIVTSEHMNEILRLQPDTRAPFNKIGRGNTGYLFQANKELAEYIIEESAANQQTQKERQVLLDLLADPNQLHESKLDQELLDEIDQMQVRETSTPYVPKPVEKPASISFMGFKSYPRNRQVALNALIRANHQCEIDSEHPSFIRKSTNTNYVEPHHLIPMSYQGQFENSLDVEANIISLCSNCHNQIHYGLEAKALIETLYKSRKEELEQAGIIVSVDDLLKLY